VGAGGEGGGPDLNMQGSKQRQMARQHRATLKSINDRELTEALARAPANQHVIWNGHESSMQDGSITARTLHLIDVTWEPIPLRILMQRAARIAGSTGLHPDAVRDAVRRHQGVPLPPKPVGLRRRLRRGQRQLPPRQTRQRAVQR